jgi:hypothetical protein
MQRKHRRLYAKPQSSTIPAEWCPDPAFISAPDNVVNSVPPDDVIISVPDDDGAATLRPFTVHSYEDPVLARMIIRRLCGTLLFATVLFIVLLVEVDHGDRDSVYNTGAAVFGFMLFTVLMLVWLGNSRLVVDPRGIHVTQHLITRSIPWDRLEDVTTDPHVDRSSELVFHTPTGKVRSIAPARLGPRYMAELATTILHYRHRIRAGTAKWEPTIGDDAGMRPS